MGCTVESALRPRAIGKRGVSLVIGVVGNVHEEASCYTVVSSQSRTVRRTTSVMPLCNAVLHRWAPRANLNLNLNPNQTSSRSGSGSSSPPFEPEPEPEHEPELEQNPFRFRFGFRLRQPVTTRARTPNRTVPRSGSGLGCGSDRLRRWGTRT